MFAIGGIEIKSSEGTTQGDPIAMSVYAIAIIPLILMIVDIMKERPNSTAKMAAYADDLIAVGNIDDLKFLWNQLCRLGPKFGYYPEASKSWLIVKDKYLEKAKSVFKNSDIQIATHGKRHLGAAIGKDSYKDKYMNENVDTWLAELNLLSKIAKTGPQAAYSCFIT